VKNHLLTSVLEPVSKVALRENIQYLTKQFSYSAQCQSQNFQRSTPPGVVLCLAPEEMCEWVERHHV
jgi:hypothetical protein